MKLISSSDNDDLPVFLNPDAVVCVRVAKPDLGDPPGCKTIINTVDGKFVATKSEIQTVIKLLEAE